MFWCHIYETMPNTRLHPELIELPSARLVKLLILNLPHAQEVCMDPGGGGSCAGGAGKNITEHKRFSDYFMPLVNF